MKSVNNRVYIYNSSILLANYNYRCSTPNYLYNSMFVVERYK